MFGYILLSCDAKPQTIPEKVRSLLRSLCGTAKIRLESVTVCGMPMMRCEICFSQQMSETRKRFCIQKAARQLYRAGVKRVAADAAFPYAADLRKSGIRMADVSKLYQSMYMPLLRRLMEALEIPSGEGHVIVYGLQANRDFCAFCEAAANIARYVTVVGPGMMEHVQMRLLDHFGVAARPRGDDGSIRGDILVCFEELDNRALDYAARFYVHGAILPYRSKEETALDTFVKVNGALFRADKFEPYRTHEEAMDEGIMTFLLSGGFLRVRDFRIEALQSDGKVVEEITKK